MNKVVLSTVIATTLMSGGVFANGIVTGPVEPGTTNPVATGYNSIASGANTSVNATNSVAFGRDNQVTGDNTIVIGGGNGNVPATQSTVIGYNNYMGAHVEQTVIGANSVVDAQGAIVVGTHSQTRGVDAVTIGNNASAPIQNSVAIGTNSQTENPVGFGQMTINGTTHVFAGEKPNSSVSFGAKQSNTYSNLTNYTRQLHNVAAGRIESDSLDAVNGSQLFAAIDEINTNGKQIKKNKENIEGVAIGLNLLGDIVNDHETAINNNGNRITTLGNKVDTNAADIRALHDVATNHEGRITTLEQRVNNNQSVINNRINSVDKRMNRLGASSAALAGLHPLDFNADDKASYAISYGQYHNAHAVALGVFYRPNERIMIGLGASIGQENQYTVNIAFKFGKGSDYVAEAKTKDARIARLERLVAELVANRNK